ncbi:hypothetical protein K432DRAFT_85503, partial [Lepidopterella palustris CBS 459.81]
MSGIELKFSERAVQQDIEASLSSLTERLKKSSSFSTRHIGFDIMQEYCYSQLSLPTNIRLLRLLPYDEDAENLRCELFEFRLQTSDKPSYPYEALSYVWGSEHKPQSIIVDNQNLNVTQNLYVALLHLRDHGCSRTIWVDAICIDQANEREKENQIPLMAEIYAKAHRVVVWLGEAEDDSDRALEAIRLAGESSARSSNTELTRQAILRLLKRPWFRRIWVLQEMAAARHVLIMCGSTEIDGHAFCLGLDFVGTAIEDITTQVTFLIRGAVFRSRNISRKQGRLSLDICSLSELFDMYHTYKVTKLHDKVYALLGMCSDDLGAARLEPDYSLPWGVLMQRVVKFILSDHVSVDTWNEKETAIIKSKGCVIGKVSKVEINTGLGGGQNVEAIINTSLGFIRGNACWLLQSSAKSIQAGDIICLLKGASKPTIIRLQEDHFTIIVIAAGPPKHIQTKNRDVKWSELTQTASFIRDFLLVWDLETSFQNIQDPGKYDALIRATDLQSQRAKSTLGNNMDNSIRTWNISQILGDLKAFRKAEEKRQNAIEFFNVVVREEHSHSLKCQCSQVPLLWAAETGDDAVVGLLLAKEDVDPDLKDYFGRTPLSRAVQGGHEAVVKLLLETGKVDADSKDRYGATPLLWAARNGNEAVIKLLLETGKVDADSKDYYGATPLLWAARNGHEAVVKLLLETGKVDADS